MLDAQMLDAIAFAYDTGLPIVLDRKEDDLVDVKSEFE